MCAGIIPWNVPLFISVLKLGPAMAAGCTIVLKPAPDTPLDAYLLAEAVVEADIPPGVVNIVAAEREVSEYLVRHPDIDKVSFTGSVAAGRKIGAICGEQLKRMTLELGGKSAAIILDDVDLDAVMGDLLGAGLMNNGQVCGAQTRLLISRNRYDEVVDAIGQAMAAMAVGDPLDPTTAIGPMVNASQRDRVAGYQRLGVEEGATVVTGGGQPDGPGYFIEPTLFANADQRHAHRPRGDLRPGAHRHPVRRRGRRHPHRQRLGHGPVRFGVVVRSRPRRRAGGPGPHRRRGHQQPDDPRHEGAVRRVQVVRDRARARTRRHRALHRAADHHHAWLTAVSRN